MKNSWLFTMSILFLSCTQVVQKETIFRTNFTQEEQQLIQIADSIIKKAYYTTLITLDKNNQPRARIVEPFLPKKEYIIWMATNPKSRKVTQLKENSITTLHYFDKTTLAYVSLMGHAFLVNDAVTKNKIWRDGWEKFYPNKEKDYLLIKFVPETLELINIVKGFTGNATTWQPHVVQLRK